MSNRASSYLHPTKGESERGPLSPATSNATNTGFGIARFANRAYQWRLVIGDGYIQGKGNLPMAEVLHDDEGNHTTMLCQNLLQHSYLVK
jgi:hypothetical protein